MGAHSADPLKFTLLQHSQQLRLQRRRQFAYFVEEYRAALRQLKAPPLQRDCSGESALFMPEQLTFE
jgi:hypothetical protein